MFNKLYLNFIVVLIGLVFLGFQGSTAFASNNRQIEKIGDRTHRVDNDNDNGALVIFVHGILGDPISTWGNLPTLLLSEDQLRNYDFVFWGFPTDIFSKTSIEQIGETLETELRILRKLYGYRDISIVAHSMGGLIARSFIVSAIQNKQEDDKGVVTRVVTYATPHQGADLATYFKGIGINKSANQMSSFSGLIRKLNESWLIDVIVPDEKAWTGELIAVAGSEDKVVPYNSASLFYTKNDTLPYGHRAIVKPANKNHGMYRHLLSVLLPVKIEEKVGHNACAFSKNLSLSVLESAYEKLCSSEDHSGRYELANRLGLTYRYSESNKSIAKAVNWHKKALADAENGFKHGVFLENKVIRAKIHLAYSREAFNLDIFLETLQALINDYTKPEFGALYIEHILMSLGRANLKLWLENGDVGNKKTAEKYFAEVVTQGGQANKFFLAFYGLACVAAGKGDYDRAELEFDRFIEAMTFYGKNVARDEQAGMQFMIDGFHAYIGKGVWTLKDPQHPPSCDSHVENLYAACDGSCRDRWTTALSDGL